MTARKKGLLTHCRVACHTEDGRSEAAVSWTDEGPDRISARITKALRGLGHMARAWRVSPKSFEHKYLTCKDQNHRHCFVVTSAPLGELMPIVREHFLNITTTETESKVVGTAIDLLDDEE